MTIPTSTYRIQFRNGMTFDRAVELVPYIKRMGISHLYASPVFTAAPGSTHGYDVADANAFEPELGGREGFERLSTALKQAGLGLILDIVPNHMAAGLENRWWRSIVEWGSDSRFGHFFDVDWTRRLTLPFLGDDFDAVLASGDVSLIFDRDAGTLALAYFESHYPLNPGTYRAALDGIDLPLADQIRQLASRASPQAEDDFHASMRSLASDEGADRLDAALKEISGNRQRLAALHDAQSWRLMSWRDAPKDLSYRRFFEITGLGGLRVEDEEVFEASHALILELVLSGKVDGLRIDHVDGLADPRAYLTRLRQAVGPDCYLIVEKILAHGEKLPSDWPISGTTGYEFIASLSDVMMHPQALERFSAQYSDLLDAPLDVDAEARDAKAMMADVNFAGEVARLVGIAKAIGEKHNDRSAPNDEALRSAIRALLIAFPVYRTYGNRMGLEPADRQRLTDVMDAVRKGPNPPEETALMFIGRILAADVEQSADGLASEFRMRFQQLTGPLMAKSVEDTLFFRVNPLIALNEVGSEPHPRRFGLDVFHADMQARLTEQPAGLSGSSTHDTKRGEDARARLYALGEARDLWRESFDAWRQMNRAAVVSLNDGPAPEPAVEWLIYQSMVGVWPQEIDTQDAEALKALEERFLGYLEKALREAKLRTNWSDQNAGYEKAVMGYASHLLGAGGAAFRRDFVKRMQPVFDAGALNSLTQTLIKLTAPGIPDIYQGSEGLDLSLVDPDNRRMPAFDTLTSGVEVSADRASVEGIADGRLKQQLISRILPLRQQYADLFLHGDYIPMQATGEKAEHIVAFGRHHDERKLMVVAPRLMLDAMLDGNRMPSPNFWQATGIDLPAQFSGGTYKDVLTGQTVESANLQLSKLFAQYPFAVLLSQ
ncbi:malto-oligosyltrehalose synthase [Rhizobium sp. SAFR-030]|uniref:malto-oligosyltrehalose synthase n=1 Tax=Rhizobium sp. SAFR-030 TaxID=3387277 RepID=UPI003F800C78